MRPAVCASGAAGRPDRTASTSATMDTAVSAGERAQVEAGRPVVARHGGLVEAGGLQAGAPLGLGVARAETADVGGRAPQRGGEHRGGEVVVVVDHDDHVARRPAPATAASASACVVTIDAGQPSSATCVTSASLNAEAPTTTSRGTGCHASTMSSTSSSRARSR